MLAAWQTVENGPWPAVSRAFVCLCLTRRLLVHRSTASTHLAKEQSSHYQIYLISTLPPLTDTQGQTVAGPSRSAFAGGWGGGVGWTLRRTGRSIKCIGDTLAVDKHQHNGVQCWLPWRWGENRLQLQWWQVEGGVRHHGPLHIKKPLQSAHRNTTPFLPCVTNIVYLKLPWMQRTRITFTTGA